MEDFSVLDSALGLAQLIGPVVVGLLTVPVLGGIKKLASLIDRLPAAVQQILAVLIASGLTWVGTTMSMVLPEGCALFANLAPRPVGDLLLHVVRGTSPTQAHAACPPQW